jgi:hypothetical protein
MTRIPHKSYIKLYFMISVHLRLTLQSLFGHLDHVPFYMLQVVFFNIYSKKIKRETFPPMTLNGWRVISMRVKSI